MNALTAVSNTTLDDSTIVGKCPPPPPPPSKPKIEVWSPSPKMVDLRLNACRAKFRLVEGAVRSAKSYTCNDIAIEEISKLPMCNVLISGYSITSVARNILAEWKKMINTNGQELFREVNEDKDNYIIIDWRGLRNKKFYLRGAGKEHDFKQIQGSTFGYWLADEFTRHCESFTDMMMTRLSLPYARALLTTNSDSPYHYVKKRFMDNPDLYRNDSAGYSLWKRWTFFLDDNPSLTDEYIDSLKRLYTGVFFQRYILARWVVAEGAIYDFFKRGLHTLSNTPGHSTYKLVGIDYGTGNPTVFIMFSVNLSLRPFIWAEREYYYDSVAMGAQKTDSEYSADLKKFIGQDAEHVRAIILDPSAASFEIQLVRDGFFNVKPAVNDVIDGIRTQARMLKSGEYAIMDECTQTIDDYGAYAWDAKAQLVGEDKPIKVNDHTKDVERYVLHTEFGDNQYNVDALGKM